LVAEAAAAAGGTVAGGGKRRGGSLPSTGLRFGVEVRVARVQVYNDLRMYILFVWLVIDGWC
jgi:hypothetical protein